MVPASRIGDMHVCPMVTGVVPHVGGPVSVGCFPAMSAMMPQARVGDMLTCVGPPDVVVKGSSKVLFGNMPAARVGDLTAHGGALVVGAFPLLIGG